MALGSDLLASESETRVLETAEIAERAAAAVFANPRQRKIVLALIAGERSLAELSLLTETPLNLLHHHMGRFLRLGLVRVARRQSRAGAPIKFYRATAKSFFVPAELAPATSGEALSAQFKTLLERGLARGLKGRLYSHDGAGPRMGVVRDRDYRATAAEFWLELHLSQADAEALAAEFQSLLKRFEQRFQDTGHPYIVHAALAAS